MMTQFPPDWHLGFLVQVKDPDPDPAADQAASSSAETGEEREVRCAVQFMPIVGMVAYGRGIAAVVALPNGTLVRDIDLEHPVVCIQGPGEDRVKVAKAGLEEYVAQTKREHAAASHADDIDQAVAGKKPADA